MAELFEEVVVLLESRSSTRALAGRFRIESQQAAGNGAVLCIPLFVAELQRWANDPAKAASLLKTLRSIDTSGLDDPGATVEGNAYDPTGTNLTNKVFGDRRHRVATAIANEAGISVQSADHLLPPTGWAFVACLVDRYGNRMDRQSLVKILTRELDELLDANWGPWMDAACQRDAATDSTEAVLRSNPVRGPEAYGVAQNYGLAQQHQYYDDYNDHVDPDLDGYGDPEGYDDPADYDGRSNDYGLGSPASVTGDISRSRRSLASLREDVPEEAGPSQIPMILAAVAVALLGILGISQLFGGDGNDATAAIGVGEGTEEAAEDATTDQVAVPLAEPAAMTLSLADPLAASTATGTLQLRLNPQDGEVCFNVTVDALAAPYDGHIHAGTAGQAGEVVVGLGSLNNGDIGCAEAAPAVLTQLLNDPASYYVDLHDAANVASIRAQLGDGAADQTPAAETPAPSAIVQFDPEGAGAGIRLETGRLVLFGEVADQDTYDRFAGEFADLEGPALAIVNDLVVVEGSPLPSGRITINNAGLFAVGSDQLAADRGSSINDLALILSNRPDWSATVVGHTDATGSESLNLDLSLRRATAVMNDLVANGVPAERLTSEGAGSADPVADNNTTEGQAQNRRIELIVVRG